MSPLGQTWVEAWPTLEAGDLMVLLQKKMGIEGVRRCNKVIDAVERRRRAAWGRGRHISQYEAQRMLAGALRAEVPLEELTAYAL